MDSQDMELNMLTVSRRSIAWEGDVFAESGWEM
jgi:hypothetical protein